MIPALTIQHKTYPCNIVQGPLAGVSCAPFRALTLEWGKPAFSYTEMISCYTLNHVSKQRQQRYTQKVPGETLCYQLSANNPLELARACRIVTDYGADLVDLNCGCPVKKIRSKKSGSFLLSDAGRIYQLIRAMKENTDKPVSIKIRVDANSDDRFNQEIANAVNDAQADFITVHGRHWTQGYDVECSYDDIRFFVNQLKIPVIGNGDVACVDSLKKMLATGCKGVMIGRAGVGQPWLIQQLIAEYQQLPYAIPSHQTIGELFVQHLLALVDLLGSEKFAILQGRAMAKYYARSIDNKAAFCLAFNECSSLPEAELLIRRFFI